MPSLHPRVGGDGRDVFAWADRHGDDDPIPSSQVSALSVDLFPDSQQSRDDDFLCSPREIVLSGESHRDLFEDDHTDDRVSSTSQPTSQSGLTQTLATLSTGLGLGESSEEEADERWLTTATASTEITQTGVRHQLLNSHQGPSHVLQNGPQSVVEAETKATLPRSEVRTSIKTTGAELEEPILTPNPHRFVLFPIKYPDIWDFYKKAQGERLGVYPHQHADSRPRPR